MTEHLPACLTPDRADELAFNDEGRAYTIEAYGTDRNGYINGDVPTKGVLNVGHGCVYITGTVGEGARLRGRQGVYCARSISASTILDGGNLLIVSNETPEENVVQISQNAQSLTPILVVPESVRAKAFDVLVNNGIRSAEHSGNIPARPLKKLSEAFPSEPMKLFYIGQEVQMPKADINRGGTSASPTR